LGRGLGWVTHRGPCQPRPFCDSVSRDGCSHSRWLHGNDASTSRCLGTTKVSAPGGGGWWILGGRGVGEHLFALPLPFICPALDRRGGWCVGSVGTFPPWDPRAGLVLTLGDVGGSPSPGGEGEGQ